MPRREYGLPEMRHIIRRLGSEGHADGGDCQRAVQRRDRLFKRPDPYGDVYLPQALETFEIAGDGIVISCLKRSRDGQGILLWLLHTDETPVETVIRPAFPTRSISETALDESFCGPAAAEEVVLRVAFRPKESSRTFIFIPSYECRCKWQQGSRGTVFPRHGRHADYQNRPGRISSFFCDSLELEGHNWTSDLFGEFEKHRGYRLQPYLYALYGELDDIGEGVRYAFLLTMSELMNENFIGYMTEWCHRVGSRSRIQAHGAWSDILLAYGLADIPEGGETFSPLDRLEVNTVHHRIASSAAHLYGRPVVSNESFTWLRFLRFTETPEQIKAAADSIFLDGMNKLYNHGYSYSPENAEGIGWPFYASFHICHTNPWWPWFHHLATYISRVSAFLQRGHCYSEVLIYLPQSDIWAENPLADLHMSMKLAERLGDDAINGVSRAGYWFDYVNDDILCRASLDDGAFVVGENRYHILLLLETERLPLETAKRIAAFAAEGGDVICAGDVPHKSVGMVDRKDRDEAVRSIMEPLFVGEMPLKGRALRAADKYDALLDVLRSVRQPDVCIGAHSDTVGYVHRQDGAADIYFLANISAEEQTVPVAFRDRTAGCELIDPMTGVTVRPIAVETQADGTTLTLRFSPFQSILAVFETDMAPKLPWSAMVEQEPETLAVGGWRLVVESMGFDCILETLNGWEKEEELTWYSGTGIYSCTVLLSTEQAARKCALCFEHIGVVAAVSVNGRQAGYIIKRPLRVELTGLLRSGENTIEVTVANLLINRAIDPAAKEELYKDDVIDEWPYFTGALNETRKRRIFCEREREAVKEPYPSGIRGSVWLEFSE